MRQPVLSLLGLYNWDSKILDNLKVPENIDQEAVKENLLIECAEFTIVYQDAEFFKQALSSWVKQVLPVWEKLAETLEYEYNPLWNKDAYYMEDIERDKDTAGKSTASGSSEHDTSAYNSSGWTPADLDKVASTESGEGTEDETIHSERREYGNIGVTTTMQLIQEQRDLVEMNLMTRIIDDFKMRFCILVY